MRKPLKLSEILTIFFQNEEFITDKKYSNVKLFMITKEIKNVT